MSTKSVISVILLCVILMACSKSDEHFKPKSEELSSALITFDSTRTECVKIFYRTNSSLDYPINIIGDYHNQFLEGLQDSIVVTDKCSESQLNAIDVLIENYLNSNEDYQGVVGDSSSCGKVSHFYHDLIDICTYDEPATYINRLHYVIDSLIGEIGVYTSNFEVEILENFIDDAFDNDMDLDYYVNIVNQKPDSLLFDGNMFLSFMAIYENSGCWWNNYEFPSSSFEEDDIKYRLWWVLVEVVLTDVGGAIYETAKNVDRNYGTYNPNDPYWKSAARGAISGSVPVVGTDIANSIFD
jgi:hypothetical protein